MSRLFRTFMLTVAGALTSAVTAAFLVFLQTRYGLNVYGFTLWFVIPLGAMTSGYMAASGYYFGSRLLNIRPTRDLLAGIILISVATFFLVYWLRYELLVANGQPVHNLVSFGQYLQYCLTHISIQFSFNFTAIGDPTAIGSAGYLYTAIQIIGFAVGGFFIYSILSDKPYCTDCKLYMTRKANQKRYFEDSEGVSRSAALFFAGAKANRLDESIRTHAETGSLNRGKETYYYSAIDIERCQRCSRQRLTFCAKQRVEGSMESDWKEIAGLKYSVASAGVETAGTKSQRA